MVPVFAYAGGVLTLNSTAVMGVLNITPDSFSDGGQYSDPAAAVARALEIERQGAAIIDIGAQSTRPGHTPVCGEEEWARLAPVLAALRGRLHIPISVDTYSPYVAQRALQNGAAILNDVSGSMENGFLQLAAQYGAGLVMTHPGSADEEGSRVSDVRAYFERALAAAEKAGLPQRHVCLDVGIGFGKSRETDVELIAKLPALLAGLPEVAVLCGASRKRVVAACTGGDVPPEKRLAGTLALHTAAQIGGARILRAHDVYEAVQAAACTDRVMRAMEE